MNEQHEQHEQNEQRAALSIPPPSEPEEPLAADKRTLVIGAIATVALVLTGVVSAALFTTSACDALEPDPLPADVVGAGAEPGVVLDEAFGDIDGAGTEVLGAALDTLADELGALTGVAEVTGADAVTHAAAGVVATGPVTTALGGGGEVFAGAELDGGRVVGSGATLYALSIGNELTDQVDALLPLDATTLDAGGCLDTATIGMPLAFHLDANDGELVLFRVDEDAGDPHVELRGSDGRRWTADLEVEIAQPGVLGERLTGLATSSAVVVGARTVPGAEAPVLQAFDRSDGEPRWSVARDDLDDLGVLRGDGADRVEVLGADAELVVVRITADHASDDDAAQDGGTLVALTLDDGVPLWQEPLEARAGLHRLAPDGPTVWVVLDDDEVRGLTVAGAAVGRGAAPDVATASGSGGRVALHDGGAVLAVADGSLLVDRDGEPATLGEPFDVRDVVVDRAGAITLLLGAPDDAEEAIAATFAGPG